MTAHVAGGRKRAPTFESAKEGILRLWTVDLSVQCIQPSTVQRGSGGGLRESTVAGRARRRGGAALDFVLFWSGEDLHKGVARCPVFGWTNATGSVSAALASKACEKKRAVGGSREHPWHAACLPAGTQKLQWTAARLKLGQDIHTWWKRAPKTMEASRGLCTALERITQSLVHYSSGKRRTLS